MRDYRPHEYQRYCIEKILEIDKLALMLDMGLGKTSITLTALNDLIYNRFQVGKVLVIAPKKVAESSWTSEAEKWRHLKDLKFSMVMGNKNHRLKALYTKADIYITNRDNVVWLVDYYKHDWPFDTVVLDESSSFKNHQSKRFKALKAINSKITRMIQLTGTPSPNGLIDLWAQVYLLDNGERLGKSITAYRERYFNPDQRNQMQIYSWKPKDGSNDSIQRRISDICISMKAEDYLELPDIIYDTIPVKLDNKARDAYEEMEKELILELETGDEIDAVNAAALSNKLLQISNGAVYDENRKIHEIHDCKIEAFVELVEALPNKNLLVFYAFKHDVERLLNALSKSKLKIRVMSDNKSSKDIEDWNNGEIDILLAHPASAAYGLNLQDGGNHVVWFGLNWSLELYQQANKRLHRQGQKEKVIIHHLVTQDTRDEDVMRALENKGNIQEELLQSLKARIEKYKRNGGELK
jgi:SNF2-related protein|nr:MAG TPA: Helicase of the snf2 rad54 family [Caudoviricetes sp.]